MHKCPVALPTSLPAQAQKAFGREDLNEWNIHYSQALVTAKLLATSRLSMWGDSRNSEVENWTIPTRNALYSWSAPLGKSPPVGRQTHIKTEQDRYTQRTSVLQACSASAAKGGGALHSLAIRMEWPLVWLMVRMSLPKISVISSSPKIADPDTVWQGEGISGKHCMLLFSH